jgi:hypothetical protein
MKSSSLFFPVPIACFSIEVIIGAIPHVFLEIFSKHINAVHFVHYKTLFKQKGTIQYIWLIAILLFLKMYHRNNFVMVLLHLF